MSRGHLNYTAISTTLTDVTLNQCAREPKMSQRRLFAN